MELDIKKYEAILKAQLVDFTKKQEDALCQLRELPNEGIGMSDSADQAQLMERQHLLNSQATRFSLRIKSVRKALKLIKDDEYGFCHSCGIDIPEEDLEKHPEREFCIECLKLSDARSKHYSK